MKLQYKKGSLITLAMIAIGGLVNYQLTTSEIITAPSLDVNNSIELANSIPEIELPNIDGELQSLKDWEGKNMIVNFWATWCAPCLREIPMLNLLQSNQSDAVQVIGIAVDREEPVRRFAEELNINYPLLIGQMKAMGTAQAFGVEVYALPFTVFILESSETLGVYTGELHQEQIDEAVVLMRDFNSGKFSLMEARVLFQRI
jgi:peroxiredoxin